MPIYDPRTGRFVEAGEPPPPGSVEIPEEATLGVLERARRALAGTPETAGLADPMRMYSQATKSASEVLPLAWSNLGRTLGAPMNDPVRREQVVNRAREAERQRLAELAKKIPPAQMQMPGPASAADLQEELDAARASRPKFLFNGKEYGMDERIPAEMRGTFGTGNLEANTPYGQTYGDVANPRPYQPPSQISREGLAGPQSGVSMMPGLDDFQDRVALRRGRRELALAQQQHELALAKMSPQERAELDAATKRTGYGEGLAALQMGERASQAMLQFENERIAKYAAELKARGGTGELSATALQQIVQEAQADPRYQAMKREYELGTGGVTRERGDTLIGG
jgi:hypothetical protein